MNKFVLLILLSFATIYSCSNKNIEAPLVNSKTLSGVWELRSAYGGMMVYNPNDYVPGNGNRWIFGETHFQSLYKDSVYRSGTYSISTGTGRDENSGRTVDQFIFNNQPSESFELRDDTLRFYYGLIPADGAIEMYVKISDDTTAASY